MKTIHAKTAGTSSSGGRSFKNSTQVVGFVTEAENKGIAQYSFDKLMSHSYTVVVLAATAKSDGTVRKLPNGFRFLSPAQVKKGNAIIAPYTDLLAKHSNMKEATRITDACYDKDFVRLNLDVAPFKTWDRLEVLEGGVLRFKVEVNLEQPLIKPGSIVVVNGVYVKLWKKKDAAAAPPATPGTPENSTAPVPAAAAPSVTPVAPSVAAAAAVPDADDAGGVVDTHQEPGTDGGISLLFEAGQVVLSAEFNGASSSPEYNVKTLTSICAQKLGNNKVIVLPFADAVIADDAEKEGLIIDVNTPSAFDEETATRSGPNEVATYGAGDKKKIQLPINMDVTEYIRVYKSTPEATLQTLAQQYTGSCEDENFPGDVIFTRRETVTGKMYATHVSKSGFASQVNWSDVNAYKRVPCTALVRLTNSRFSDTEKKAYVVYVEWGTKAFMLENSFPVPLDFAWTIIGRKEKTGGITAFGMDSSFDKKRSWPIRNVSNDERGNLDLLLTNEADVPVAPYLDPANKWLARVMMIPNHDEFNKSSDAKKATTMNAIAQGLACKTPEAGETFVREYVTKYAEDMTLETFGKNKTRHRVFVWFYKPDEAIYKNDMPVYEKLRPEAKEPAAKKQKVDDVKK